MKKNYSSFCSYPTEVKESSTSGILLQPSINVEKNVLAIIWNYYHSKMQSAGIKSLQNHVFQKFVKQLDLCQNGPPSPMALQGYKVSQPAFNWQRNPSSSPKLTAKTKVWIHTERIILYGNTLAWFMTDT